TLSELTRHAGVVLAPNPSLQRLRHIEFRKLRAGAFLSILVTSDGRSENRLIQVDFAVDDTQLERIHNYLNELLAGMTLDEMRQRVLGELGSEKSQYDQAVSAALRLGKAALERSERIADVVVTGKANLLDSANSADPAYMERLREL